jgi:hypothetical protein
MNRIHIVAGACSALLATAAAHADEKRVLYFDAGLGVGVAHYGDPVDDVIHFLRNDLGYKRIGLSLDATAGGAVRPGLYVVGSLSTFTDVLWHSSDFLLFSTYMLGPGVRYYPLASHRHLLVGADVGITRVTTQVYNSDSDDYDSHSSDIGTGFRVLVAYDLDWKPRGPTVQVGTQYTKGSAEDFKFNNFSVYVKFAFK